MLYLTILSKVLVVLSLSPTKPLTSPRPLLSRGRHPVGVRLVVVTDTSISSVLSNLVRLDTWFCLKSVSERYADARVRVENIEPSLVEQHMLDTESFGCQGNCVGY